MVSAGIKAVSGDKTSSNNERSRGVWRSLWWRGTCRGFTYRSVIRRWCDCHFMRCHSLPPGDIVAWWQDCSPPRTYAQFHGVACVVVLTSVVLPEKDSVIGVNMALCNIGGISIKILGCRQPAHGAWRTLAFGWWWLGGTGRKAKEDGAGDSVVRVHCWGSGPPAAYCPLATAPVLHYRFISGCGHARLRVAGLARWFLPRYMTLRTTNAGVTVCRFALRLRPRQHAAVAAAGGVAR